MHPEMPAPDTRNRRSEETRSNSLGSNENLSRAPAKAVHQQQKVNMKEKSKVVGPMDRWVEPALDAPKPSYQDQGAGPYGVLEHMQPLGEMPNAKVRARAKADGARKSVLGRSSAAVGGDTQETPEGSPTPFATTPQPVELLQAPVIVDDDKDGDYAPTINGKKRDRASRSRAVKQKSESAPSATSAAVSPVKTVRPPISITLQAFRYDEAKLKSVVESAKDRARDLGQTSLLDAIDLIYQESLTDLTLRKLLEATLGSEATQAQVTQFQAYVKAAKTKLKDAKRQARLQPASSNGVQQNPRALPSPFRTSPPATAASSSFAIPSTESVEVAKPKISLKVKAPVSKSPTQRRTVTANGKIPSVSPRKRAGSAASDSSLTSLTSNEDDDMDIDGLDELSAPPPAKVNNAKGKNNAAERGSLAVPGGNGATKRSSADAELEEERDRTLAAKKQKLSEKVARDFEFQESNVRPPLPAPRSRTQQLRTDAMGPSALRLEPNGNRAPSTRASRAASTDVDSPLSELSPVSSRQNTPKIQINPPKPAAKRAKTKQSPEKRQQQPQSSYGGMSGAGGAGRESPIGDDDNEEASENNDFCEACNGSGYLLCCDGCDRSFHFECLDPPLSEDAKELDEPWYCFICIGKRPTTAAESSEKQPARGLFAPLLGNLKKRNPKNFELPDEIQNYYDGVAADKNGNFVEAVNIPKSTRSRPGYSDEVPNYFKERDVKGNFVLCYSCGKSSSGKRAIVSCDRCSQNWHLDCLDPPLANPPNLNQNGRKAYEWICPLHADQELRRIDVSLLGRRTIHVRKPKNAKVVETSLSRSFRNNGIIDVIDNDTDSSDSEFFEDDDHAGIIYKLPSKGLKLDFIDRVKNTRVQYIHDLDASCKRARLSAVPRSALEQANFAKRPFNEKQVALQLAQFASDNQDLDLGSDQVSNLIGTLIAEAPTEVVDGMMAAEDFEKSKSTSSVAPPSPPSSEQPDQLLRKDLELLQELIRRRLENTKT